MAALQFGGGTYSVVLQVLLDKLSSLPIQHYGYLCDVEDKLKSLKRTVLGINSLAFQAEMLHVRDPVLDIWLTDLKDVAWDAEDLIDDFAIMMNDIVGENQNLDDIIKNKVKEAMNRYNIGKKIEEIQKRLSTIASERRDLGLTNPPPQPQIQMRKSRVTTSLPLLSERVVFGRDDDRRKMVRLLLAPSVHVVGALPLPVIPIVGMGGLGKTTLARAVYNDPEVKNHFKDLRIWVYVSEDLNVRRITEEIFEKACGKNPSSIGSMDILQDELTSKLSEKMFLLVLDDVWTEDFTLWDTLLAPLNYAKEGSKVVITTRSMKVADIIGTVPPLSLGRLPEPECWNLFKARAFVKSSCDARPRLEKIGRKIVERVGGVPLAVNTIGGLCSSNLDEGKWTAILNSEMWTLQQQENDIMHVLRLSYQQMPTHLKLCFKFCSIFPKGHWLDKDKLVRLWMAHGFVQPRPQEGRPIEDIVGEYFDDLLCRSFFQKERYLTYHYSMHDLMHDLAQSISAEECVIINDHNKQTIPEKVRHLSLHLDSSIEFEDLYKLKGLRTLAYFEKRSRFNFSHVPRELFENLKYLRVLDLSESGIVELPDSIGLLKHLRHLDLSWTEIRSLPREVGDLCNLQTLDLRGCNALNALPESMNKLTNLRNIYEKSAGLLSKLVGIGILKSLQKLGKFEVSRENGRKVGELKELTELRELVISQLENVLSEAEADEASLTNKQYLRRLVLQWGAGDQRENGSADEKILERLKPHPNLKALEIKCNDGINFPSWLADQYLSNLEQLTLENCRRWKVLGQLSSLKKLTIKGMEGVVLQNLTALEELTISGCEDLSTLGIQALNSLEKLYVKSCPKLTSLTDNREGLQSFIPLKTIEICGCDSLESLPAGLHHLSSLKKLEISNCEELSTLGIQALYSLKRLRVENCPKLTSLTDNREWLQNFIPLEFIMICYCDSLESLPAGLHHLSSLKTLNIRYCPQFQGFFSDLHALEDLRIIYCEELSTLGIQALNTLKYLYVESCPKLTSLTDNREGLQNFIPLEFITIWDCASLESLPAGLHHLSSLKELEIKNCPQFQGFFSDLHALENLRIIDCEELSTLGIQALNSLKRLDVINCPKLTSLTDNREGLQNFIPVETIEVHDCASLESLPAGLHHLSSLKTLNIRCCPQFQGFFSDLHALEDLEISNCEELSTLGIQALNSLEILVVESCPKLTSLTDNREGLQNFIPLKFIKIRDCVSFAHLPAGLHHLSSLKKMVIGNCPQFQGFFSDLHALRHLKISNCEELSTLGIQALNSLKHLNVKICPKLTSLTDNREGLQSFVPLETIKICDCASLERLPSGLNHLSSLYKLVIKNCPRIQSSYPDLPASLQIFDIN